VRDRFPHGTWFVDLASVRDPGQLESAIAAALAVRESPDRAIADALRAHLRDRTTLLLLDNLEQLLPAAAEIVAGLVRAAPALRVLVTSRELLRISGELGYPVPPLDLGSGVALFEDRARSLRPDLVLGDDARAAILAICERLGGLPLAIELAAARIRLLSPSLILERLGHTLDLAGGRRDMPERQQTLRGAIAWSHDLLADEERRLFRRLGVFAGGWTPEAAADVADAHGDLGIDLHAGLESLADKSLVRIEPDGVDGVSTDDEVRFGQHPLLREYAIERLTESGEREGVEALHATVSAAIAEAEGGAIFSATGPASLRRLDHEEHNLRKAVEWSIASDEPRVGLAIMGATWRWFQQRGRIREGRALLAELLAKPGTTDVRIRIAALAAEGGLAYWMDDFVRARAVYEERLELANGTGDAVLIADANYDLGFLHGVANDGAGLRALEERALELYTAAGREDRALLARQALVLGMFLAGDYAVARDLTREHLEAFRRSGSVSQVADSMTLLSAIHYRLAEVAVSWERMVDGLRIFAAADNASGIARALAMAAILLLGYGDVEFGARVAGATYELVREKGVMLAPVRLLHLPNLDDLVAERFGPERAAELLAAGAAVPLSDVIAEILGAPPPNRS
jgi:predicted ATPase